MLGSHRIFRVRTSSFSIKVEAGLSRSITILLLLTISPTLARKSAMSVGISWELSRRSAETLGSMLTAASASDFGKWS